MSNDGCEGLKEKVKLPSSVACGPWERLEPNESK